MLELNFAFFHMMNHKRQGLAGRKYFLDRLAPAFYKPRVETLISFEDFSWKGCNLLMPLGQENWAMLEPVIQDQMINRGQTILGDYSLQEMAVDRTLKSLLQARNSAASFCFGDEFVKALAVVVGRKVLSRHAINRLILVGEIPGLERFLEVLSHFETPITVQSSQPSRYEIMDYRLLYEKGLAVSNGLIQPRNWQKGDLILAFEPGHYEFVVTAPGLFFFGLDDSGEGLAPDLENILEFAGLNPALHTLAPILESCLCTKAGFQGLGEEITMSGTDAVLNRSFESLIQAGDEIGLWESFLDKGI